MIETTAEHPFYTQTGWKDAADLTPEDQIKTKNKNWQQVKATNFLYQKKKVYNFGVADWHTYFVGVFMWLVHNNSKVCLVTLPKEGVKYAKNILNGQLFDKAMRKAYGSERVQIRMAHEILKNGKKVHGKVLDVLTDNEIISHKFTQLSEITFNTAKKYIDEIILKYADKMTDSTKLIEQRSTKELEKILEIPPQFEDIPPKVLVYARDAGVEIREISGEALEQFNKMKFW